MKYYEVKTTLTVLAESPERALMLATVDLEFLTLSGHSAAYEFPSDRLEYIVKECDDVDQNLQ